MFISLGGPKRNNGIGIADIVDTVLPIRQMGISVLPKFMELAQGQRKDHLSLCSAIPNMTKAATSQLEST